MERSRKDGSATITHDVIERISSGNDDDVIAGLRAIDKEKCDLDECSALKNIAATLINSSNPKIKVAATCLLFELDARIRTLSQSIAPTTQFPEGHPDAGIQAPQSTLGGGRSSHSDVKANAGTESSVLHETRGAKRVPTPDSDAANIAASPARPPRQFQWTPPADDRTLYNDLVYYVTYFSALFHGQADRVLIENVLIDLAHLLTYCDNKWPALDANDVIRRMQSEEMLGTAQGAFILLAGNMGLFSACASSADGEMSSYDVAIAEFCTCASTVLAVQRRRAYVVLKQPHAIKKTVDSVKTLLALHKDPAPVRHLDNAVNLDCPKGMCPAIILAADAGNVSEVIACLHSGHPIDIVDSNGRTALFYAARWGHLQVVKVLVENGANVNLMDKGGSPPIEEAVMGGHEGIVTYLVSKGARFDPGRLQQLRENRRGCCVFGLFPVVMIPFGLACLCFLYR